MDYTIPIVCAGIILVFVLLCLLSIVGSIYKAAEALDYMANALGEIAAEDAAKSAGPQIFTRKDIFKDIDDGD